MIMNYPLLCQGLSPRVRGNREPQLKVFWPYRSIPACAGEPGIALSPPPIAGVYPRVCGGTNTILRLPLVNWGLSPRVRGNLQPLLVGMARTRSIPACAGEPI